MVLRVKVLRKKSERLERKRLQKYVVISEKIPAIEDLLDSVYRTLRPKPSDYELRRALVFVFNELAKDIYGPCSDAPVVEEFGSFLMDLFTAKSDLDLSVNFGNKASEFSREKKIQRLRKFAKKLYALQRQGHVYGVHPITTANVPILKVVDRGTGIECDISVENRDGVSKSKIVHMICSIDQRFGKLSFLMKAWAKAQNINSSKFKTLNSLSIILLVAFHLQTRNPPILPPFSALSEEGADPETVSKSVLKFANYGKNNKESVAELFVTLLIKLLSVENLWCKGICASTYEGCWISKTWDFKVGCISVEDFTDRSQNVARAVGAKEVKKIYKCIHLSSQQISAFMEGRIEGSALKEYLFGRSGVSTLVDEGTKNKNIKNDGNGPKTEVAVKASQQTIPHKPVLAVRNSAMEGWDASPSAKFGKSATKVWGGSPSGSWGKSVLDGWGGSPSGSWGKSTTDGWGGSPTRSWGKPAVDLWGESPLVGLKKSATKGWGGGSPSSWEKPAVDLWGGSALVSLKKSATKGWGGGSPSRSWEKPAVDLWGGSASGGLKKSDHSMHHKPLSKKRKWSRESQEGTSTGWSGTSSVNDCAGGQQTTSYNLKKKFKPFNNWRSKHAGGWESTPQQPVVGGGGSGSGGGSSWGKWGRG